MSKNIRETVVFETWKRILGELLTLPIEGELNIIKVVQIFKELLIL